MPAGHACADAPRGRLLHPPRHRIRAHVPFEPGHERVELSAALSRERVEHERSDLNDRRVFAKRQRLEVDHYVRTVCAHVASPELGAALGASPLGSTPTTPPNAP